jgi:energy-coupling factor transporter transmembrane protein EcfT
MMTSLKTLEPWLKFAGCVLVIAVLYWAQAFLVPLALAVLLAFFLAPVVALFQRRLGQVPAVMTVAIIVFALMGLAAWGLVGQGTSLANELPTYRTNIRQKLQDIRGTGKGGSVEKIQETVKVSRPRSTSRKSHGKIRPSSSNRNSGVHSASSWRRHSRSAWLSWVSTSPRWRSWRHSCRTSQTRTPTSPSISVCWRRIRARPPI